jgi:hypothetical protein
MNEESQRMPDSEMKSSNEQPVTHIYGECAKVTIRVSLRPIDLLKMRWLAALTARDHLHPGVEVD